PFPDYYASTVILLEGRDILAVPAPMVAIGISPRSFGYFYVNDRAQEGMEQLGSLSSAFIPEATIPELLPGDPLLNSWYASMACVERNFGQQHSVRVDT